MGLILSITFITTTDSEFRMGPMSSDGKYSSNRLDRFPKPQNRADAPAARFDFAPRMLMILVSGGVWLLALFDLWHAGQPAGVWGVGWWGGGVVGLGVRVGCVDMGWMGWAGVVGALGVRYGGAVFGVQKGVQKLLVFTPGPRGSACGHHGSDDAADACVRGKRRGARARARRAAWERWRR